MHKVFLAVSLIHLAWTSHAAAQNADEMLYPMCVGDKCGYIDDTGAWRIAPDFKYAKSFSDGLAVVGITRKMSAYIDQSGDFVIGPDKFANLKPFFNGTSVFSTSPDFPDGDAVMLKDGQVIKGAAAVDGDYLFKKTGDDQPWTISNGGAERPLPKGFYAYDRDADRIFVKEASGEISILNYDLEVLDLEGFDAIFPNIEGFSAMKSGDVWGYADKDHQVVIEPRFIWVQNFNGGVAKVVEQGSREYSLISQNGEVITARTFSQIGNFQDGYAYAITGYVNGRPSSDTTYHVLNIKGEVIYSTDKLLENIGNGLFRSYLGKDRVVLKSDGQPFFDHNEFSYIETVGSCLRLNNIADGTKIYRCMNGDQITPDPLPDLEPALERTYGSWRFHVGRGECHMVVSTTLSPDDTPFAIINGLSEMGNTSVEIEITDSKLLENVKELVNKDIIGLTVKSRPARGDKLYFDFSDTIKSIFLRDGTYKFVLSSRKGLKPEAAEEIWTFGSAKMIALFLKQSGSLELSVASAENKDGIRSFKSWSASDAGIEGPKKAVDTFVAEALEKNAFCNL